MQHFSFTFKAMGAPCEIQLYCRSKDEAQAVYELMLTEIRRLENKYSRYNEHSVTSQINRAAGQRTAVSADGETIALLRYAEQLYEQSDGMFDITSGVLRRAWNFKSNQLPPEKDIEALLPLIDWPSVEVCENTVRLPKQGMEIDFGGYVKEFTSDVAATKAVDAGIRGGMINLGGDIRIIGPHPDGSPWRVGIQHPRLPAQAIAKVNLIQGAIATSGDYERYMIINKRRYCHLLDPKSGMSLRPTYCSVSVLADSCLIAGSFSTISMLKSEKEPDWLEDSGLAYLVFNQKLVPSGTIAPESFACSD